MFVSAIINDNNKNYQPQLLRRNFFLMRFLNASIYSGNFSHTDDFECERLKIYLRIKVSDNAYLADVNFLSFLFFSITYSYKLLYHILISHISCQMSQVITNDSFVFACLIARLCFYLYCSCLWTEIVELSLWIWIFFARVRFKKRCLG